MALQRFLAGYLIHSLSREATGVEVSSLTAQLLKQNSMSGPMALPEEDIKFVMANAFSGVYSEVHPALRIENVSCVQVVQIRFANLLCL